MEDNFDARKWFKKQYLNEGEIGSINSTMDIEHILNTYSLSELLDFAGAWYGENGETIAQDLSKKYASNFRKLGLL